MSMLGMLKLFRPHSKPENTSSPKLAVITGPAVLEIEDGKVLNLSDHAAHGVRLERDGQTVAELDCLPAGCQWERDATGCVVRWSNRAS